MEPLRTHRTFLITVRRVFSGAETSEAEGDLD